MTLETTNNTRTADRSWTVKRVLEWTVQHLREHGSQSPRLDAEILLAHARDCQRIDLYTHFDDMLSDSERAKMRKLVKRRANSEPVAYLVEFREFFSMDFHVTRDVMIPRPETETLVMAALDIAKPLSNPRILDLGTGSGCIAIAIAANLPTATLTAIDTSKAALVIARQNVEKHRVTETIEIRHGNLFEHLPTQPRFEVIVSNPPYVVRSELKTLQADVRKHEPHIALDGGPNGLTLLQQIVKQAPSHLAVGGHLLLEFDPAQADSVCQLIESNGSYTDSRLLKDMAGESRVVVTTRSEKPFVTGPD